MKTIEIPTSCGRCKYGRTYDLSVDDLVTKCFITGHSQDWCDFPRSSDRMYGCPLPNVSDGQLARAKKTADMYLEFKRIWNLFLNTKGRIQKKNITRLNRMGEKIDKRNK